MHLWVAWQLMVMTHPPNSNCASKFNPAVLQVMTLKACLVHPFVWGPVGVGPAGRPGWTRGSLPSTACPFNTPPPTLTHVPTDRFHLPHEFVGVALRHKASSRRMLLLASHTSTPNPSPCMLSMRIALKSTQQEARWEVRWECFCISVHITVVLAVYGSRKQSVVVIRRPLRWPLSRERLTAPLTAWLWHQRTEL